jgi:capsid assembly protease
MQPVVAEMLSAPWAVLPDRLPFVRATLNRSSINRRQVAVNGTAKVTRRGAGDGAIAVLPFHGVAVQRTDAYGEALGLLSLWHFTRNLADEIYGARSAGNS